MQAQVRTTRNGTVLLRMDAEAAHATFGCVIFASRYHEGISSLKEVAEKALEAETKSADRRDTTCR